MTSISPGKNYLNECHLLFLDEYSLRNFQNKKKFFTRGFKIKWVTTNFFTTKTVFDADSKKSVQKIFGCQLVKLTRLKSCGKSFLRIPSLSVKISHLIDIKNIFGIYFWNKGKKLSLKKMDVTHSNSNSLKAGSLASLNFRCEAWGSNTCFQVGKQPNLAR